MLIISLVSEGTSRVNEALSNKHLLLVDSRIFHCRFKDISLR